MNILFLTYDEMAKVYSKIACELNTEIEYKNSKYFYIIESDAYKKYILENSPKDSTFVKNMQD